MHQSERTARDMVQRLALNGHLSVETGHGPGPSSRYNRQPAAALNRKPASALNRQPASAFEMKTGSRLHENRQAPANKTGSRLPTNHLIEPSEEPSEERVSPDADLFGSKGRPAKDHTGKRAKPSTAELERRFEEFYAQYPKK